jgi:uncharacterized protein YcnI
MKPIFLVSATSSRRRSRTFALSLAMVSLLSAGSGLMGIPSAAYAAEPLGKEQRELSQDLNVQSSRLPGSIQRAILQDASRRTGIDANRLRIVQVRQRTFSNTCEFNFGEVCTGQYNPIQGWEVTVRARRQFWVYHVDRSGSRIVPDPSMTGSATNLPNRVQNAVLRETAARSGLPISSLQITQVTPRTFSNPCEFNFGEICTREYNPIEGWEVVVQGQRQSWTYHVDRSGSQIVLDPKLGNSNTSLPSAVRNAVLRDAARWTGSTINDIRIEAAEPKTWGNNCVFGFGNVCPMNYQPVEGWEVRVSSGLLNWVYHTNQNGTQLLMDQRAALPDEIANAIAQDVRRRWNGSVSPGSLRFLTVKEDTRRTCSFLINCRNEVVWLAIVSNGQQQWAYEADFRGRQIQPIPIARVRQAENRVTSDR